MKFYIHRRFEIKGRNYIEVVEYPCELEFFKAMRRKFMTSHAITISIYTNFDTDKGFSFHLYRDKDNHMLIQHACDGCASYVMPF